MKNEKLRETLRVLNLYSLPLGGARVPFSYSMRRTAVGRKPSPRGEGGSAYAESDEGLTYPKDHLNKEYATLPRSSVNTRLTESNIYRKGYPLIRLPLVDTFPPRGRLNIRPDLLRNALLFTVPSFDFSLVV